MPAFLCRNYGLISNDLLARWLRKHLEHDGASRCELSIIVDGDRCTFFGKGAVDLFGAASSVQMGGLLMLFSLGGRCLNFADERDPFSRV